MSLFTPESGLILWMLLSFLIVVGILGKFVWPSILKAVEERSAFIAQGVEDAREAARRLEDAEKKQQEIIERAHTEQIRILNETEKLKSRMLEQARQEAAQEKQHILEQTNQDIAQARMAAMKEIRKEVVNLSVQVSEKILRQDLQDKKTREDLIEKMLDELMVKN